MPAKLRPGDGLRLAGAAQLGQEGLVQLPPDALASPVPDTVLAGQAAPPALRVRGQVLPGDAGEGLARSRRLARATRLGARQQGLDPPPKLIGDRGLGHDRHLPSESDPPLVGVAKPRL